MLSGIWHNWWDILATRRPNRQAHGFTLIELLVAVSIFAIMSVVAYRGLNGVLQARERVTQESRKWQEVALFCSRLEGDFTAALERNVRDGGDLGTAVFVGTEHPLDPDGALLEFSRTGLPGQSGKLADVQRIGYRLRDASVEQMLWPVLDRTPRSRPEAFVVLPGVRELKLRYLDEHGTWHLAWPMPGKAGLPRAVELKLVLHSGEQVMRVFAL